MKKLCIICDIDGVYMDSSAWLPYLPKGTEDRGEWNKFANRLLKIECYPNSKLIKILTLLNKFIPIIFLTGREDLFKLRKETIKQIENFSDGKILLGNKKNILIMRGRNDFNRAEKVKEKFLKTRILPNFIPLIAIDDSQDNIDMFRSYGIFTICCRYKHS